MNQFIISSTTFGVVISIVGYQIGLYLKRKFKFAILNPLLISIIFVMGIVIMFKIDFATFNSSAQYLSYLLTPATVCFAIPLYQKLSLLKEHPLAIIGGILSGVLTSLISILFLSSIFNLTYYEYVTLLPKSITTAIGLAISEEMGGYVPITVTVIIITGILGNIVAESVCKLFSIKNPISRGIAIGTSSHVIGTTKAMELGEIEGAISSLSIVISGLFTIVGVSIFANFL